MKTKIKNLLHRATEWLRELLITLSFKIENCAHWLLRFKGDELRDCTWRDHVRWWIEGQCTRLFALGYNGSDAELEDVWNGDIPLNAFSERQREYFDETSNPCDDVHCIKCHWSGLLQQTNEEDCPYCDRELYLGKGWTPAWRLPALINPAVKTSA